MTKHATNRECGTVNRENGGKYYYKFQPQAPIAQTGRIMYIDE